MTSQSIIYSLTFLNTADLRMILTEFKLMELFQKIFEKIFQNPENKYLSENRTMINEEHFFWKNFRLGTELQVAGTFLYNGLFALESMQDFQNDENCFEFLYNISVGIERLEKIVIVLHEHNSNQSQEQFEKSLISHNHYELYERLAKLSTLKFDRRHSSFLQILSSFYQTTRYERFNIKSVYETPQEKESLINFLTKHLELKTEDKRFLINNDRTKRFLGKVIGHITISLYELLRHGTKKSGTFTDEVRFNSKAYKIFMEREFDFISARLMQREIILYLLKNLPNDQFREFILEIPSLPLEEYDTNTYIRTLMNYHSCSDIKDEIEQIYTDNPKYLSKDRIEQISVIGSHIDFDSFPSDDDLMDGPDSFSTMK